MYLDRLSLTVLLLALAIPGRGRQPDRPGGVAPPPAQSVVIWKLTTLGLDEATARKVHYDLKQAFQRAPGFSLLSDELAAKRLKQARVKDHAPLEKVAVALKVAWVLTGTLGGLGEESTLDLRLVSGKSGKKIRQVAMNLPIETQSRRAALDELLVRLLTPEKWVGTLDLEVSVGGAQVHLDGNPVTQTPLLLPLAGLKPGKHILRITKEGYGEFSRFVVIRYNQVARLRVDLTNAMVVGLIYETGRPPEPQPEATRPPSVQQTAPRRSSGFRTVATWTFMGVGAGLVGTGVWLGVSKERMAWSAILSSSGGVMLTGSLVLLLLGDGGDSSNQGVPVAKTSVLPAAFPGGLGVSLYGSF